jgi:hypothetical protein
MILINLLPPELRKRAGGVNPIFLAVIGGAVVNVALLGFWLWLHFMRLPHAEDVLNEKIALLEVRTAEAQVVIDLQAKIAEAKVRRNKIVSLLARKMYWAKTLDDFANLLTGKFGFPGFNGAMVEMPGLDVRIGELTIKELGAQTTARRGGGASKGEEVVYGFKWKYKLLGTDMNRPGEYVKAFFKTTERSVFWTDKDNNFNGKPEDGYFGDRPEIRTKIGRVVVEGTLEWQRHKTIAATKSPEGEN